ncbi:hypothetical protein [Thalassobacillus sp. CUG 92003]|uniref:hypothetical protein n=1 Tax=Thalassobacillus sp. CUG 92003 TaxID=2736641 RepID=UPI0015E7B779|nr:hypothetical protein [Thalassobacillus sp. CUG 92003]
MRSNITPIFPIFEEFLELVALWEKHTDETNEHIVPQTMSVLNKVYAQGMMEGYKKAVDHHQAEDHSDTE